MYKQLTILLIAVTLLSTSASCIQSVSVGRVSGPWPAVNPDADAIRSIRWARIPAGTFQMGCTPGDLECFPWELPTHEVTLTRAFELMATEVTLQMLRTSPSGAAALAWQASWNREDDPVRTSWDEAQAFCTALSGRLPTEAEWEYAARGGQQGFKYPWGNEPSHALAKYARIDRTMKYSKDRNARLSPDQWGMYVSTVASYPPNGYGLYDMAGNEEEWVADWFDANYYSQSVTQNPVGPSAARSSFWSQPAHRVVRGGSWFWGPRSIRVSARSSSLGLYRSAGFRCAREAA